MAYHVYHDQPCPACGHYYVRFDPAERCPACGSDVADVYDLVSEVVEHARRTFVAQGDLELGGFQPITPADRYLVLAWELLDAYRLHPELDPALVAAEAMQHFRRGLEPREAVWDHWQRFFTAVLERWLADRHRPLSGASG